MPIHSPMRFFMVFCFTVFMTIMFSNTTLATGGKGKPYKHLQKLIHKNNKNIDELSEKFSGLKHRLYRLEKRVSRIDNRVHAINDRISIGDQSIEEIKSALQEAQTSLFNVGLQTMKNDDAIAQLQTELIDQRELINQQHQQFELAIQQQVDRISTTEAELDDIQGSLLLLAQKNIDLALILEEKTNELGQASDSNSQTLVFLQSEFANLASELSSANADYNYLLTLYMQLKTQLEEQNAVITTLSTAVSALQVGSDFPDNGSSDQVKSFSFTDNPDADDTTHVDFLRQFLLDHYPLNPWVHVIFSTASVGRTTELCIENVNDVFSAARNIDNHDYVESINSSAQYRLNGGQWTNTNGVKVESRKDDGYNYIFMRSTDFDTAMVAMINIGSNAPLYDSMHQKQYFTVQSSSPTTVVMTFAVDRMTACGF